MFDDRQTLSPERPAPPGGLRFSPGSRAWLRSARPWNRLAYIIHALPAAIAKAAEHLDLRPGTRVLDFGCGEMPYRELFGPGVHYVGADLPGKSVGDGILARHYDSGDVWGGLSRRKHALASRAHRPSVSDGEFHSATVSASDGSSGCHSPPIFPVQSDQLPEALPVEEGFGCGGAPGVTSSEWQVEQKKTPAVSKT